MGILDEAIREHLELKRQHGAGDSELKQLEDEAFGPPERPDAEAVETLAEAPTEFMAQPEEAAPQEAEVDEAPAARRAPDIADLQEAPAAEPSAEEEPPAAEEPPAGPSTEEREAIAEQPTALYDVEGELGDGEEEDEGEEKPEPEPDFDEEEEDEDFWSEQRLSEELDQALETPEEEDLLEETPDFLEEAPEDDQLWFEQKPPKDFDFDD